MRETYNLVVSGDAHPGESAPQPEARESGPVWQPSPLERLSDGARRRWMTVDHRDVVLEVAVVLLIGSSVLEVIAKTIDIGSWSPRSLLANGGLAGNFELVLLRPALAVFVVALLSGRRRRVRALHIVLRWVVGGLVLITIAMVGVTIHAFVTDDENPGPPVVNLVGWLVSIGAVSFANLSLLRTDRSIG
jgi:hypothetical protein